MKQKYLFKGSDWPSIHQLLEIRHSGKKGKAKQIAIEADRLRVREILEKEIGLPWLTFRSDFDRAVARERWPLVLHILDMNERTAIGFSCDCPKLPPV